MLKKYIGKKVRLLVSSKSGAGISSSISVGRIENSLVSMIVVFGIIKDVDDKFVELKDTKLVYNELLQTQGDRLGVTSNENYITLVNIDSIITVSIL